MKFEHLDPAELAKKPKKKTIRKPDCKVYYNAQFTFIPYDEKWQD